MFKLFVFACLLAVAAASGAGVVSTYAAPSVVSPYSYSPLSYSGYYGYPYANTYAAAPLTYGSYGSPYVRSLAYTGYGGYSGYYPYSGYKYAY